MRGAADGHPPPAEHRTLFSTHAFFVDVCQFTFEFVALREIEIAVEYFSQRIHPSSRYPIGTVDHGEAQRWFECIPGHLRQEANRVRVVAALRVALAEFVAAGLRGQRDFDRAPDT
jgi:hypothetical protein